MPSASRLPEPVDHSDSVFQKLRFILALSSIIKERTGVSRRSQFADMIRLYLRRGLGPLVYYQQNLWRPELTIKEKLGCMTKHQFYARVDELNPPAYQCVARHKVIEAALFKLFAVPCAEHLGFLHPTDGIGVQGQTLTKLAELNAVLDELCPLTVCFKPVAASQGRGFMATRIVREKGQVVVYSLSEEGQSQSLSDYLECEIGPAMAEGLIIQRYIEQHPTLASFNPSSVNTLRIWALQCGGTVKLRGAVLRMGRSGQLVDNASRGGLIARIDMETGRLSGMSSMAVVSERLTHHPDTGTLLDGVQLPFWEESKELAKTTMRVQPMMRFSGLDIAITETGPLVVETNARPARISARNFGASMQDLLDCAYD